MEDKFLRKNFKNNKRVQNFIERVCIDFELELDRTQRELGENPLCYREETMSSFLFPALRNNSIGALMEVYYKDKGKRHADFYALDKSRECSYIIEFKHMFSDGNSEIPCPNELKKWPAVNEQIEDLNKKIVNTYIDDDKDIYGLSFYMLTVYGPKEMKNDKILTNIKKKLNTHMKEHDWAWNYELPENLYFQFPKNIKNEVNRYSHVIFLGKVKVIDKI